MKVYFLAACMAVMFLAGCQLPDCKNVQQHTGGSMPSSVPLRTPSQLQSLWLEGDIDISAPLPLTVIRADSDRVTLSWNGDAVELLSALARARGLAFSYAGIRLPLPVDIEVQDMTYANLLRLIEMQTAWRATVMNWPGQMVLQFMPSLPAGPVRHTKGGRR